MPNARSMHAAYMYLSAQSNLTPCVLTPGDDGENGCNGARAGVKGQNPLISDVLMISTSNSHSRGPLNGLSEANWCDEALFPSNAKPEISTLNPTSKYPYSPPLALSLDMCRI